MRILPIDNSKYQKRPNFQSCLRRYISIGTRANFFSETLVRTSTNMFREDLNWMFLIKYMLFNFMKTGKINTYSMACSDGSEAYSFAMFLLSRLPENMYKKFFPVMASDFDEKVIEAANNRRINIHDFEFDIVNRANKVNMRDFFEKKGEPVNIENDDIDWTEKKNLFSYEPTDELKQAVQFKRSDILTELKNIKDYGDTVVFCRNVMPYLNGEYINEIVKTASQKLKTGSMFITGEFDERVGMTQKLQENGFYRPVQDYSYIFVRR